MRITRKTTNKLVSYVDRYFTYDERGMKREGTDNHFDFYGVRHADGDKPRTLIAVDKNKYFLYACIRINGKEIYAERIKTHKELNAFKAMVRCLG